MKSYPYIYSLSTIGLIHHYNSDYLFNRTRTDFTGDGGTGKSMIADFLQLIFVGAAAFESASEPLNNDQPRTPSGMVLVNQSKGYSGKGYAFLNVAVAEHQYLVIGVYIEGTTNQTRPFLIHSGYDSEQPAPNKRVILHQHLLREEQILPVEDLIPYLSGFDLTCVTFGISSFHKVLFEQRIIPFDLVNNPKKLNSYALIIQSFSRGKGFKFDSKSLQDFLFGNDREKKIKDKYDAGVKSISDTYEESFDYLKQINLLRRKREEIQQLTTLHGQKHTAQTELLNARKAFNSSKAAALKKSLIECETKLATALIEANLLRGLVIDENLKDLAHQSGKEMKWQRAKKNKDTDEEDEKAKRKTYDEWNDKFRDVEKVETWLNENNCSLEQLKDQFKLFTKTRKEISQLKEFKQSLEEKQIDKQFESLNWVGTGHDLLNEIKGKLGVLEDEIAQQQALQKFSQVDQPDSLAFWAIQQDRAFSPDEEATLLKLQELLVSDPKDSKKRYLPKPEVLFKSLKVFSRVDGGFWLDIGGVVEFVPGIKRQFLDTPDAKKKKEYFSDKFEKAAIRERELQKEVVFYKALQSIPGLSSYLDLYQRATEIGAISSQNDFVPTDTDTFDNQVNHYSEKDKITSEFKSAETQWNQARTKVLENRNILEEFPNGLNTGNLEEQKRKLQQLKALLPKHRIRVIKFFRECKLEPETVAESIQQQLSTATPSQLLAKKEGLIGTLKEKRKQSIRELGDVQNELNGIQELAEIQQIELERIVNETHVPSEEELNAMASDFTTLKDDYRLACRGIVDDFLSNDKHRYQDEEDWKRLARAVLPEVFKNPEITEDDLSSEVDQHLQRIIDANTLISDRKIKTLLDIVDQVDEAVNDFVSEINDLRKFFDRHDTRITGGHKAVLKQDASSDYPIKWIDTFKKMIKSEASQSPGGLFEIANESIHFQDLMIRAFKACGGRKQNPKIHELLNPKNYFQLSFDLIRNNMTSKGSNSQVYSATALLCIARMSLIEKDASKKRLPGLRFMPIDEAEGLGSNYEMLSEIAKSEDYQIVSMSINPVGEFEEGNQYTYMLHEPEDEELRINGDTFAQFKEEGLIEHLEDFIYEHVSHEG
jgi:hypothetical protein